MAIQTKVPRRRQISFLGVTALELPLVILLANAEITTTKLFGKGRRERGRGKVREKINPAIL